MNIAYCGLDCDACEARLATIRNDDELRRKVAEKWSALNGVPITPEQINCTGCRGEGVKTVYCERLCPVRQCATQKGNETCGQCPALDACEKIAPLLQNNEEARRNLKR